MHTTANEGNRDWRLRADPAPAGEPERRGASTSSPETWLRPSVRGIGAASLLFDLGHEIPSATGYYGWTIAAGDQRSPPGSSTLIVVPLSG